MTRSIPSHNLTYRVPTKLYPPCFLNNWYSTELADGKCQPSYSITLMRFVALNPCHKKIEYKNIFDENARKQVQIARDFTENMKILSKVD